MKRTTRYSIVVPFYNEVGSVEALHAEIAETMKRLGEPWEAIYIDDGSTDGTYEHLAKVHASDPDHTVIIRLRRNFGQTAALAAGFDHSRGAVVIALDGDRQNDPGDIARLSKEIDKGYDVVSGWRRRRRDPLLSRRLPSWIANWLIGVMTGVRLHDHGCTLKAYRREVLEQITLFGEMHRFIPAQAKWVGARICEVPVNHRPRTSGASKYGIWRTYRVMLDLITVRFLGTHGTKPLHAFGALGLVFVLMGFGTLGVLAYMKYATGVSFIQSPLLLLSALFVILGGQSILLGLLAEIAVRTYYESQNKPIYIVRETLGRLSEDAVPGEPGRDV